jgi:Rieske Fe-S protein
MTTEKISRRTLGGIAAAGAGLPLVAACGGDDGPGSASDSGSTASTSPSSPSSSAVTPSASASSPSAESTGAAPDGLTSTSDIPVGGGTVFVDEEVVVTQPSEGDFKCFTAICSHQGCLVANVSDGTINCDCHGSKYDIESGDVEEGPATFPLEAIDITVSGDQISLA